MNGECHRCEVALNPEAWRDVPWDQIPCSRCASSEQPTKVERRHGEVSLHEGFDTPGPTTWKAIETSHPEHNGEASSILAEYLSKPDQERRKERADCWKLDGGVIARWSAAVAWDDDRVIASAFQAGWTIGRMDRPPTICEEGQRKRLSRVCDRWPQLKPWLLPRGGK
jgi:hypothetical protein